MDDLTMAAGTTSRLTPRTFVNSKDVKELLGCESNKAYEVIRNVNGYAKKKGLFTFPEGKANKYLFAERFGIPLEVVDAAIKKNMKSGGKG